MKVTKDYTQMTKKQMQDILDTHGVKYRKKDKRDDLIYLLVQIEEVNEARHTGDVFSIVAIITCVLIAATILLLVI